MNLIPNSLLVALATGCIATEKPIPVGPFIRTVEVEGHSLIVESCTVLTLQRTVSLGTCTREQRKLPFTGHRTALQLAQVEGAITPAIRTDIAACGARAALTGNVVVHVEINYTGRLVVVQPKLGDRDFADCVGSALSTARFPPSSTAISSADISFDLGAR